MSRPHNAKIRAAVMGFVAALLLSLGMSMTLLRAMLPHQALWPTALYCFGFTLAVYALFLVPLPKKSLIPLAAVACLCVWGALGGGPIHSAVQLARAAVLAFQGVPEAVAPYADTARWCVCLFFSLLAAALVWEDSLAVAIFTVVAVLGVIFQFGQPNGLLRFALPAAAGLLLMMAEGESRRYSVLPVAAVLVALAFFLVPIHDQTVSPMDDLATEVREFVEDYLVAPETRSSFSLASEGFQPYSSRLGGQATPQQHNVMDVTTDRTVLLRARTYNDYSGLNWYDTLSTRRYLYVSPRFSSLRDALLDLNRPLCGDTVETQTISIHMLDAATTTLFVPAYTRTVQLESDRMVLYFNQASELYLTRDLAPGDTYTLTYSPYAPGTAATEKAVAACAEMEDPYYAEVAETYLAVPRHIQQDVIDLARQITAGCETPYEKALALQDYLRSNYRYTLNVKDPPEVDFVTWFLIGERQGYCTYFASAMTILCRIVGLPARYVTGYLAVPDETGVATVTGEMAHAWTEVYLNGFGWLDFDATARSDNDRSDPNEDGEKDDQQPPRQPTPTPAPSPSPTPPPRQDGTPTPTPTPEPTPDQPTPTPTPPPDGSQTPAPTPPPEKNDPPLTDSPFFLALLAILLLIALVILRFLFTEPLRKAARKPDTAAETLFSAICGLLAMRGIQRKPQETLHDFALRCDEALGPSGLPSLAPIVYGYAAQVYGNHPARTADFEDMYRTLRSAATPWARFRLALKRFFTVSLPKKANKKSGK